MDRNSAAYRSYLENCYSQSYSTPRQAQAVTPAAATTRAAAQTSAPEYQFRSITNFRRAPASGTAAAAVGQPHCSGPACEGYGLPMRQTSSARADPYAAGGTRSAAADRYGGMGDGFGGGGRTSYGGNGTRGATVGYGPLEGYPTSRRQQSGGGYGGGQTYGGAYGGGATGYGGGGYGGYDGGYGGGGYCGGAGYGGGGYGGAGYGAGGFGGGYGGGGYGGYGGW